MDKYDNLYDYLSREDVAELGRSYLEGIFAGDGHEKRVEEYALSIFDALSPSQKVLRNLLSAAARLHDIGHSIDERKHDLHTRTLLKQEQSLKVLPKHLFKSLMVIAGGHRKKIPEELRELPEEYQEDILKLMGILRVADAIDIGRDPALKIVHCHLNHKGSRLSIEFNRNVPIFVIERVAKKGELFETTFGLTLYITP